MSTGAKRRVGKTKTNERLRESWEEKGKATAGMGGNGDDGGGRGGEGTTGREAKTEMGSAVNIGMNGRAIGMNRSG